MGQRLKPEAATVGMADLADRQRVAVVQAVTRLLRMTVLPIRMRRAATVDQAESAAVVASTAHLGLVAPGAMRVPTAIPLAAAVARAPAPATARPARAAMAATPHSPGAPVAQVAPVALQQLVTATVAMAATVDYPTESVEPGAQALAVLPEHPANRKVPDNKIHTCEAVFAPLLLFDQMPVMS
jgi:hypothetical protein